MLTITVVCDDTSVPIRADEGTTLLATIQRAGGHISAPCGGAGTCGKCVVRVEPQDACGEPTETEARFLSDDPRARLACRCRPTADVRVTVPQAAVPPVSDTDAKGGAVKPVKTTRPAFRRIPVTLPQASLEDQRSLCERIRSASGYSQLRIDPRLAAAASTILDREELELIVEESHATDARLIQIRLESGHPAVGVAYDIGTTTVAGYLVDLSSGMVLASSSQVNAQGSYGADVITRITAAARGNPLGEAIRTQLGLMTKRLLELASVAAEDLCAVTIVGNTTMVHLLLDLDAQPISRAPFIPTVTEAMQLTGEDVGLNASARAPVYIAPCVSSYVGADIVSDLIATGAHATDGLSILIDVGTNGEIVAGTSDGLIACSTAAGPAFEGATITYGSAGVDGAISHVSRQEDRVEILTIGGIPAQTICGTGLIDAIAMLLEDGLLDESGMITSAPRAESAVAYADRCLEYNGESAVLLSEPGAPIRVCITQSDIRQVQLAKGAIAAGIRVILDELGADAQAIERIYLAGGFGTYVRPEAALRVGLLPRVRADRIEPVGNAAGAGAVALLLSADSRRQADDLRRSVRYLELSGLARFQTFYMDEMLFPAE